MLLKDIVELVVAPKYAAESIYILEYKVGEHRDLQSTFRDFKLQPKHHFTEHYPHLIGLYGPLCVFWTMHFEGKHIFIILLINHQVLFSSRWILNSPKPSSVEYMILL